MNKMIRTLCLIVLLTVLTGCTVEAPGEISVTTSKTESKKEISIRDESSIEDSSKVEEESSEEESVEDTTSELNSIDEMVMLEQDGIKITAKEYVDDLFWGEGIKVLIENSSETNVGVQCNAVIVNNYMISDLFACDVAAGKKSNETIYLLSTELEAAGIENIGQIEVYFHIYNSDTYETLFDSECITIQTSSYSEMDVTPADGGAELYNQDGIRIVGKVVDEDSFWGSAVLLYLENNTGSNVIVSCEDMSINGFMVNGYLYSEIYDGKMSIDEIIIFQTDLDENDIDAVEEIELSFHIFDADSYMTIAETDPISFTVK